MSKPKKTFTVVVTPAGDLHIEGKTEKKGKLFEVDITVPSAVLSEYGFTTKAASAVKQLIHGNITNGSGQDFGIAWAACRADLEQSQAAGFTVTWQYLTSIEAGRAPALPPAKKAEREFDKLSPAERQDALNLMKAKYGLK